MMLIVPDLELGLRQRLFESDVVHCEHPSLGQLVQIQLLQYLSYKSVTHVLPKCHSRPEEREWVMCWCYKSATHVSRNCHTR
jgi:hypothetical protein